MVVLGEIEFNFLFIVDLLLLVFVGEGVGVGFVVGGWLLIGVCGFVGEVGYMVL